MTHGKHFRRITRVDRVPLVVTHMRRVAGRDALRTRKVNGRYGMKCKLCGQWRRTVLAVKSEEPKMKRLSKLRHFIYCLHKTGLLHLQPWLWIRTVWWSIRDAEDVTSSPVCQRTAWHWCYTGPVDGARLKRRRCGAGGGVGGAQRSVHLLQSTATRRCCRLVARHLLSKCRTSGEMFLGRTKQIVVEEGKWMPTCQNKIRLLFSPGTFRFFAVSCRRIRVLNTPLPIPPFAYRINLIGCISSKQGHVKCGCEYGDELLGSIRCGKFYELLTNWWLIERDVAPWC